MNGADSVIMNGADSELSDQINGIGLEASDSEYESADDDNVPVEKQVDADDDAKEKKAHETALEARIEREASLNDDERLELKTIAQKLKDSGNEKFKAGGYSEAVSDYTQALDVCPLCFSKERAVMLSNRAASNTYLEKYELTITDCTEAINLDPLYLKPLLRRAQVYEKTEKLDEALADYKKILEMDPKLPEALTACQRLPILINERNEKLKTEMLGKLKDLGNVFLRPFGLSTDNFKFVQNESGGYSVNFQNKS